MAGPTGERIRIRMEGYDHEVLDRTAAEIVKTAQENQADVRGPIPLPTRIERYTVLRSPHIDRKSREQFEKGADLVERVGDFVFGHGNGSVRVSPLAALQRRATPQAASQIIS